MSEMMAIPFNATLSLGDIEECKRCARFGRCMPPAVSLLITQPTYRNARNALEGVDNLANTFGTQALLALEILAQSVPYRTDANIVHTLGHSPFRLLDGSHRQPQDSVRSDERAQEWNGHVGLSYMNARRSCHQRRYNPTHL